MRGWGVHYRLVRIISHGLYHRIVRIISPWAMSLTSALNRGGLIIRTEWIYHIYQRLQGLQAREGGGPIIHQGLIIRTRWYNTSIVYSTTLLSLIYWAVYWVFYWHVQIVTHCCATITTHFQQCTSTRGETHQRHLIVPSPVVLLQLHHLHQVIHHPHHVSFEVVRNVHLGWGEVTWSMMNS